MSEGALFTDFAMGCGCGRRQRVARKVERLEIEEEEGRGRVVKEQ
jgi:hypothetical protein